MLMKNKPEPFILSQSYEKWARGGGAEGKKKNQTKKQTNEKRVSNEMAGTQPFWVMIPLVIESVSKNIQHYVWQSAGSLRSLTVSY